MPRPGCPSCQLSCPARRAVATRLSPTGWQNCRFPLVRRHRTRNGTGKPVTGLRRSSGRRTSRAPAATTARPRSGDFGKRRLSHVRDQRLDCQRVGPPRLVPGPGAADRPVILDAHEEHSAGPVGRTYHRLDEVAVVQLFSLLALELDLMGLPASDPLRDTQASPLSDPTAASAPHTRSYATPSQAHRRPANAQDRPCRLRTSHRRQTSACLTAEHPVLARHQGWPGPGQ